MAAVLAVALAVTITTAVIGSFGLSLFPACVAIITTVAANEAKHVGGVTTAHYIALSMEYFKNYFI